MADGAGRSPRLDRVEQVGRRPGWRRDGEGKEALYSTSPTAEPSSPVLVACERCDVEQGLGLLEAARLLLPLAIVRPFARRVWTRCPTCERRAWLRLRQGQVLRALLERDPRRP